MSQLVAHVTDGRPSNGRATNGEAARYQTPVPAHRQRMLISSAGRRVELMRCFRRAAVALDLNLEILACDMKPEWSAACIDADRAFSMPRGDSDSFVPAMLELCATEQVGLLVPTIDTELIALSHARDQFASIGTLVAVGAPGTVEMARDKLATARFLSAAGVPTPRTSTIHDLPHDNRGWIWPLIAKPRHGSSSRGIAIVESIAAVAALNPTEPYIVQEFITGREVTISMYFDNRGSLRCTVPHERLTVRAGEVEKGVTVRDPSLIELAARIATALDQPRGVMCFQAIIASDGIPSVFEINARFGGGYPLADHAGATFARWLLESAFDRPDTACDAWQSDVVMLRYDAAMFV